MVPTDTIPGASQVFSESGEKQVELLPNTASDS